MSDTLGSGARLAGGACVIIQTHTSATALEVARALRGVTERRIRDSNLPANGQYFSREVCTGVCTVCS